jgi:hypothetical protein
MLAPLFAFVLLALLGAVPAMAGGGGALPCGSADTNGNSIPDYFFCSTAQDVSNQATRVINNTGQDILGLSMLLPGTNVFDPSFFPPPGVVFGDDFIGTPPTFTGTAAPSFSPDNAELLFTFTGFGPGQIFGFEFDVDPSAGCAPTASDPFACVVPLYTLTGLDVTVTLADGSTRFGVLGGGGNLSMSFPSLLTSDVFRPFGVDGCAEPDPLGCRYQSFLEGVLTVNVPLPAPLLLLGAGLTALGLAALRRRR